MTEHKDNRPLPVRLKHLAQRLRNRRLGCYGDAPLADIELIEESAEVMRQASRDVNREIDRLVAAVEDCSSCLYQHPPGHPCRNRCWQCVANARELHRLLNNNEKGGE